MNREDKNKIDYAAAIMIETGCPRTSLMAIRRLKAVGAPTSFAAQREFWTRVAWRVAA